LQSLRYQAKGQIIVEPVIDTDEPTSKPDKYRICTRRGNNGFDDGFIVSNTFTEIDLASYDSIYSFKVTALNDGGESFDSEVLSVGINTGISATSLLSADLTASQVHRGSTREEWPEFPGGMTGESHFIMI